MPTIDFRALVVADAAEAAKLIRAAFAAQDVETDPPSSALNETTEAVARKLAEGGGVAAIVNQEIVAVVLYTPNSDALYLGRLAVAPAWRGQRLSTMLLALAETDARRLGFAKMRLRVRLQLPANRRLFERNNYHEVVRLAHDGYEEPTFAVMEKRLEIG